MVENWVNKYSPKTVNEVIGQEKAITELITFLKHPRKKAALLYGPPGVGKTSSVYAISKEMNYEILELNASDFRKRDIIREIIGNAISQKSLFFKEKLILIDEIDGISTRKDYGGLNEILRIIKETKVKIILTANDPFDKKFNSLRKAVQLIEFSGLKYTSILERLKYICDNENIRYEENALRKIAINSAGDMRAAINDLMIVSSFSRIVNKETISILSNRDKKETIIDALIKILKAKDYYTALNSLDNVDLNPDEIILWIDENIFTEYEDLNEISNALDYLSKADIFRNRITKWQYWRFLVYYLELMSIGTAFSKKQAYKKPINYKRPQRILSIWIYNNKYKYRTLALEKIARKEHCSIARIQENLSYFKPIFKTKDQDLKNHYELTNEELKSIIT